uniref:MalT-like TPR region domain-containing protein n=1 Tax=Photinus pyralis TaxID=7054 RepID=A0A1Y1LRL0_PHOPY
MCKTSIKKFTTCYGLGGNGTRLPKRWELLHPMSSPPILSLASCAFLEQGLRGFSRIYGHVHYSCKVSWERASDEARELALRRLCKKTDLHRQAIKYDGLVDSTVKRILDQRPSAQLGPGSHSARPTIGLQLTRHVFLPPILFGQARQASTLPNAESLAASDAAVLKATPIGTENKLLLILLSFLSDSQVSVDMFFQAAMPRRGWATDGGVESSSEWVLGHTLSTNATIKAAFDRLVELSLISSTADARYSVNADTRTMILNTLPLELHSFWRQQALYVACAAIPWKYLHSPNLQIRETIKPHIIHTLNAVRDCDGYESVPLDYMTGLVSALTEASRFSGLKWKRTMITEARKILSHSSNDYLELLIVQREVLLDRLSKEPATTVTLNQDLNNDRRTHAASGSAIIQEALNHFQNEELSLALSTMNKWSPMQDPVSTLENIIIFRINILRGKILRYQGKFEDAVQSLRLSQDLIKAHKEIYFDEDIGDLISELADTLQELGDFAHSEALLRTQLSQDNTPATKVILQLSLTECLFAQQNVAGAEVYYADLKKCDTMTKMARLRLCIIAAKLCHVQSNLTDAFAWWTEALQAINKFPPTSGNATCIIYLSLCDVLKRQGQKDLEQSSLIELAKLQSLSSHAEAKYWIAGLRRWHEYISSPSS